MEPEPSGRWTSIRTQSTSGFDTPGHDASRPDPTRVVLLAAFFSSGAQGVHEDGTSLVAHFPPGADIAAVHRALTDADPDAIIETSLVPDVDWSQAWKTQVSAHELGTLAIVPPWLASGRDAAHTVIIDPGMAFGTGDHATTRGVMRLMPSVVRRGDVVADLGSGSAVLSIAAAKLGAARVYAIEVDADATSNAQENVERNGVEDRVHLFEADAAALLPLVSPVRVVLANIISSVLLEPLTSDGVAILSGMLLDERATMVDALVGSGWRLLREDAEDIWWSVAIERA